MHAESMRHDAERNEQWVEGLGTAIFCRALGAGLIYFAINTTPVYTDLVENTVLLFAYPPWHHLPLPAPSSELLEALRWTLLACGCGIAIGVIPRVCLLISGACVAYQLSLDRTIYNNHYVLIIMLCWLLLVVDGSCLAWRLHLCSHAPSAQSAPSASPASPALPSWQLTAVQLLLPRPTGTARSRSSTLAGCYSAASPLMGRRPSGRARCCHAWRHRPADRCSNPTRD